MNEFQHVATNFKIKLFLPAKPNQFIRLDYSVKEFFSSMSYWSDPIENISCLILCYANINHSDWFKKLFSGILCWEVKEFKNLLIKHRSMDTVPTNYFSEARSLNMVMSKSLGTRTHYVSSLWMINIKWKMFNLVSVKCTQMTSKAVHIEWRIR